MRDVNNKKLEMGNEEEKRENEKWEQNLTWTLTLSVSWFLILCFVAIFHFFRSRPVLVIFADERMWAA